MAKVLVALASALLAVLAAELFLQVASPYVPALDVRTRWWGREIRDPVLGRRGRPDYPGHDARGFRNPRALDRADIVVLGDSQVYGARVSHSEMWSAVLARNLEVTGYNMSFGGWGATQAAFLFGDALALDPRAIVFSLYLGNDFMNGFRRARALGLLGAPVDIRTLAAVAANARERGGASPRGSPEPRKWLDRRSRVLGLLRRAYHSHLSDAGPVHLVDYAAAKELAGRNVPGAGPAFEGPEWRTVFRARRRFRFLDDRDPSVRAGVEVTKAMVLAMAREARNRGVTFIVALVPSKESVFAPRIDNIDDHIELDLLVAAEARLRSEIAQVLLDNDVCFVDVLPPLARARRQPYPEGTDGHPDSVGYRIVGETVADALKAANAPDYRLLGEC